MPGWYGVNNVKWLSEIHAQEDQYLGKFQARWYRTLRGETIDGETKWVETAVTHMQLKSFIARVGKGANGIRVLGVVLNDGTPIKSVEVKVDDGSWQPPCSTPRPRRAVFVEDLLLPVDGRHAGRAHARVSRHRRQRSGPADTGGPGRGRRRSSRTIRSSRGR
jgi:DMSO/TMAO reductase YedYZ molybdopterin-dependent catalytic subunit